MNETRPGKKIFEEKLEGRRGRMVDGGLMTWKKI
jgi:hypothetical protein